MRSCGAARTFQGMAKKGPRLPATARVQALVDTEVAIRMDEALAALKRHGVFASVSMFVEIALRELLARRDLPEIMRRHKATARRDRD
jgi:hypothetical protein